MRLRRTTISVNTAPKFHGPAADAARCRRSTTYDMGGEGRKNDRREPSATGRKRIFRLICCTCCLEYPWPEGGYEKFSLSLAGFFFLFFSRLFQIDLGRRKVELMF